MYILFSQFVRSFQSRRQSLIKITPLHNAEEIFTLLNYICLEGFFSDYLDFSSFLHKDNTDASNDEENIKVTT